MHSDRERNGLTCVAATFKGSLKYPFLLKENCIIMPIGKAHPQIHQKVYWKYWFEIQKCEKQMQMDNLWKKDIQSIT